LIYTFHFGIGWRLKNDTTTTFDRVEETGKSGKSYFGATEAVEGRFKMKQYLKFNSFKVQLEFASVAEIRDFMTPGVFLTFINRDNNKKWPGIPVVKYADVKDMKSAEYRKLIYSFGVE
jgi:hypothetical protein